MTIPFSRPVIDDDVIAEMMDTLTNTGWLTSGPKVRALEDEICKFTESEAVLCVNSWTSGAMLVLHWFGVGPGDEVIIPAYTYCATAMCAMNLGAKPVMVDVKDDFTIDPEKIAEAITEHTKAIIPVDLAGLPADYGAIREVLDRDDIKIKFSPKTVEQNKLGRILLLADAAHSLGAKFKNVPVGNIADVTVFSFHSVKNITTGEGGAIVLNMPTPYDNSELLKYLRILSLNGQNKSALEKNALGAWRYDIIAHGLKINMPDLCASVGLAQIRRYKTVFLPERKKIFQHYLNRFSEHSWAILPTCGDKNGTESSYHLFLLRINGITEEQRDLMIRYCGEHGIGVNVHYIPMAEMTLFKGLGYNIADYPNTLKLFKNEISLPLYNNLSRKQDDLIIDTLINAYEAIAK